MIRDLSFNNGRTDGRLAIPLVDEEPRQLTPLNWHVAGAKPCPTSPG